MIPRAKVTHCATVTRPVLGSNAAGDSNVPTGVYASTRQVDVPCIAEQVAGDVDASQARAPFRAAWRVTFAACVDVQPMDRVDLRNSGDPAVTLIVTDVRRYPVPARVAHIEAMCRESVG